MVERIEIYKYIIYGQTTVTLEGERREIILLRVWWWEDGAVKERRWKVRVGYYTPEKADILILGYG